MTLGLPSIPSSVRRTCTALLAILGAAPVFAAATPEVPAQLDLKTAIEFAITNNFAIQQARERIRQQEGVLLQVRAGQLPAVTATGSYQRNSDDLSASIPPSNSAWALDVSASQVLYAGGGVRAGIRGARRAHEAAVLDLRQAVNQSLLEVRTNFYSVLLAREKVTVQEQSLALLEEQKKTVDERFEAGTVSQFEALRALVAVENARVPLISARNEFRLAIENLRLSLGFSNNTPENLRRVPEFLGRLDYAPATIDLAEAIASAQANRPDLQRLARLIEAQDEAVEGARASRRPTVSLAGGWQSRGSDSRFRSGQDGLYVGLRSQWSLFDGRATQGRVLQARSTAAQLRLQQREAELAAEVEVRRAYSSFQEAVELASASQRVVQQAEEALRLAVARFSAGGATQLDTLQAQVELTTARTNQVQAFYNHNVALARLRTAMGLADGFHVE